MLPRPEADGGGRELELVPPRDALEQQLVRVWEAILERSPIGIRDDFFELGGHSLLAVKLFSRIERLTGKRLPLVTLFEARTIERLAKVLQSQGWRPRWTSLVPINPDGTRPPFYCVHGVGGNILEFEHFSRYIEKDQPLYGIQAQGLDGKHPRHKTVEEMAAHYIKEIRDFQPQGPYYLGGSSFGGLVAYEIAQQLLAQGEQIGILIMFDTFAPGYPKWLPGMTVLRKRLNYWHERFDLHWSNLMVARGRAKFDYMKAKSIRLWDRRWKMLRQARSRANETIEYWLHPRAIREVREAGHQAHRVYQTKPYPGKVTLLRAMEQPHGTYDHRTNGWTEYALGGVEVHEVPGHHGGIMREPRARILVQELTACLNQAYQQPAQTKGLRQEEQRTESSPLSTEQPVGHGQKSLPGQPGSIPFS